MNDEKKNKNTTKKKQDMRNDFRLLFNGAANIQFTGSRNHLLNELKVAQEHYAIVSYSFQLRDGRVYGNNGLLMRTKPTQTSTEACHGLPEKNGTIQGQSTPHIPGQAQSLAHPDNQIELRTLKESKITPVDADVIRKGTKTIKRIKITSFDTLNDLYHCVENSYQLQNPFERPEVIYNTVIVKHALMKKQKIFDTLLDHFRSLKRKNGKEKITSFRIYLALHPDDYKKPYHEQFDIIIKSLTKLMKKLNASHNKEKILGHFWVALFNKYIRTENGCVGLHLNIYLNDTPTHHFVENIKALWCKICQGGGIPISRHKTYRPDEYAWGIVDGYAPLPQRFEGQATNDHRDAIVMIKMPGGKDKSIPYMLVQPEKKDLFEKYLYDLARESFCPPIVTTFSKSSLDGYKKKNTKK